MARCDGNGWQGREMKMKMKIQDHKSKGAAREYCTVLYCSSSRRRRGLVRVPVSCYNSAQLGSTRLASPLFIHSFIPWKSWLCFVWSLSFVGHSRLAKFILFAHFSLSLSVLSLPSCSETRMDSSRYLWN
jgi:hypothetical protein